MSARSITRLLGVTMATTWALLSPFIVTDKASAGPCPDVEVVFARGTNEPPGVGGVGDAFANSLRSQVGGRSVGVLRSTTLPPTILPGAPKPEPATHVLISKPLLPTAPTPESCSEGIHRALA